MIRLGRAAVGLGLLFAWFSLGRVLQVDGLPYAPAGLAALPMNAGIALAASVVYLGALGMWVWGRGEDVAAAVLVVLLAAGGQVMSWQAPDQLGANGATMLPGASLLAWWVGRRTTPDPAEQGRRAVELACGIVAAGYVIAAASKLTESGLAWAGPANIGMQVAAQAWLASGPLRELRLWAASLAPLCGALGVGTLILEGGAVVFLVPALRLPWALLLVCMHVGISLLMGLHHYDWMWTQLGWALWSSGRSADARGEGRD